MASIRAIAAVFATAALTAGLVSPARAAHDTDPPDLDTPVKAQFVVGSQLHQFRVGPENRAFYDVPMRLRWSAADAVDPELNFDVWQFPQGNPPERIADFITETVFDVTGSDYDGFFGGGNLVVTHWSVQAYDDSGNSVERAVFGAQPFVQQDDPARHTVGSGDPVATVELRYVGDWHTSTCTCYAAKTTRFTRAAGAAVVITVTIPPAEGMGRVALVLDQGPARGAARIKVDGELRATVDTGTAVAAHKTVVWAAPLSQGEHVVRVANAATAGRSRIDFDAVLVN